MQTVELLKKGCAELDISISEDRVNTFMTFLKELKKWNRVYNLTALKTDRDIVLKHFIDSLLYVRALPANVRKAADAGSGAGFPGIPIKIIRPEIEMTLIEPARKKAAFLRHMIRQLRLPDTEVREERIEDLGDDYHQTFDAVTSRATFSITKAIEAAYPYIRHNGVLVLSKGPKVSEELIEMKGSPHAGHVILDVQQVKLPMTDAERNIVVLQRKD